MTDITEKQKEALAVIKENPGALSFNTTEYYFTVTAAQPEVKAKLLRAIATLREELGMADDAAIVDGTAGSAVKTFLKAMGVEITDNEPASSAWRDNVKSAKAAQAGSEIVS